MDPAKCLTDILMAMSYPDLNDDDKEDLVGNLHILADWVENDGFTRIVRTSNELMRKFQLAPSGGL